MKDVFNGMMERRFWDNWDRRFNMNNQSYVNPANPEVASAAKSLDINTSESQTKIAKGLWDFVRDNHEYNLTKRWRKPGETLNGGKGDCEDYVFLIASLLPHFGVTQFKIVAGEAFFNEGSEFHVWMDLDGTIIDPTAPKSKVPEIEYVPELTYDINVDW